MERSQGRRRPLDSLLGRFGRSKAGVIAPVDALLQREADKHQQQKHYKESVPKPKILNYHEQTKRGVTRRPAAKVVAERRARNKVARKSRARNRT